MAPDLCDYFKEQMRLCVWNREHKLNMGGEFVLFTAEFLVLQTVPGSLQVPHKYMYKINE